MWLQRANLEIGGQVRALAIDVRESVEVVREVTLRRVEDRVEEGVGTWRVYTIYGREPIFADANNVVVGDMMGMRPGSGGATQPEHAREGAGAPREIP